VLFRSILAHGIAQGEIDARAYTRSDLKQQEVTVSRPNVSVVDLRLLKRRMQAQARAVAEPKAAAEPSLVVLTGDNRLSARPLSEWQGMDPEHRLLKALTVLPDEPLLLVTSPYRFLLSSARQLMDLQALGQSLAELFHFTTRERVFGVSRWQAVTAG